VPKWSELFDLMAAAPSLGLLLKEPGRADILAFLGTLTTPPKGGVTVPPKSQTPNPYE